MSAKMATNLHRSRMGSMWSSARSSRRAPNSNRDSSRLENLSGPNERTSMTSAPDSSASMRSIHTSYDYCCFVARHANTVVAPAKRPSVTRESQGRLTELGLMILAWIIVGSFYVLASLGAKGHLPNRLGIFLTSIIAISLAMHVCIRFLAPNASQILLPIATLLNGVGYVEIARWNPPYAGYQALWFLVSAVGLVATLILVRRVRDLDRYRYLTLLTAIGLLLMPLVPHIGISKS